MSWQGYITDKIREIEAKEKANRKVKTKSPEVRVIGNKRDNQQIRKGIINDEFSKYDEDYYSGLREAYLDAYTPQLTNQYNTAFNDLSAKFRDEGTYNSAETIAALDALRNFYNEKQARMGGMADDYISDYQNKVDTLRKGLMTEKFNDSPTINVDLREIEKKPGQFTNPVERNPNDQYRKRLRRNVRERMESLNPNFNSPLANVFDDYNYQSQSQSFMNPRTSRNSQVNYLG